MKNQEVHSVKNPLEEYLTNDPLFKLDTKELETKRDYDFKNVLNVYEVASKEPPVRNAFNSFTNAVKDIFSFEGRNRKMTGAKNYTAYSVHVRNLCNVVRDAQVTAEKKEGSILYPDKFFSLLLVDEQDKIAMRRKGKLLNDATQEVLTVISEYMAYKYDTNVKINFDACFFTEKYEPENGLFDKKEYDEHIKNITLDEEDKEILESNAMLVMAKPSNSIYGTITREWLNGDTTRQEAKLDLSTGKIMARYKEGEDEEKKVSTEEHFLLKNETFSYDGIEERVSSKIESSKTESFVQSEKFIKVIDDRYREREKRIEKDKWEAPPEIKRKERKVPKLSR